MHKTEIYKLYCGIGYAITIYFMVGDCAVDSLTYFTDDKTEMRADDPIDAQSMLETDRRDGVRLK